MRAGTYTTLTVKSDGTITDTGYLQASDVVGAVGGGIPNTAWSTTGLTTTNFSSTSYRWRVFNGVFYIQFYGIWSGGTVTSDASGNIADQTICVVPTQYSPNSTNISATFDIGGVAAAIGIVENSTGNVTARVGMTPSVNIFVTGRSVTFGASWCLA
jgi:hypothetical protein